MDVADSIGTITLNRPEKLNACNPMMAGELFDALKALDRDPKVRVVVITGAGRAFCSGTDVGSIAEAMGGETKELAGMASLAEFIESTPLLMRRMKKPIIASINGPAVGLGCTIALACDIRIASESARMGATFARMCLIPEFGPPIIWLASWASVRLASLRSPPR